MLKEFKLISSLILILPIFFQLTTSKPFIRSLNISKINKGPNYNHLSNDNEEQMAIMFNKSLDFLIPRRRLLDNHNSHNYSKLKGIRSSNFSINENNLSSLFVTSTLTSDLLSSLTNVNVNTEYFSNAPIIYEDSTHVRRKRNVLDDENQSKFDDEHEIDEKANNKRSSSSSDNDDNEDQNLNVQKSESDELEDYNEESNDNETDDQDNVVQSKDTKTKRESTDYDYVDDHEKSLNDVRVKRDETKQTNDKVQLNENSKNTEVISSDKIDEKSNEPKEEKRDASDEKKLETAESPKLTKDEQDSEYEKRIEDKIKRKIDSIKEEIKREIERKRRDREIEKNNAKFDELQSKDNEQEDQEEEIANVEEKVASKRSSVDNDVVRPKRKRKRRRRRRRSNDDGDNKIRHRLEEIEGVDNFKEDDYRVAESIHKSSIRKRFAPDEKRSVKDELRKRNRISLNKAPVKKREKVRQMFIVKNNNDERRRKKRKRRIVDEEPKQAHVKIEDELSRDLTYDPRLRKSQPFDEKKSQSDLRALASSPRDSNRRLITDYNEAFGGLQSLQDNPNGALTRFKRIKRVLQNSQTLHKNK